MEDNKRIITAAEVMAWRRSGNRSKLTDEECEKIGIKLTSMRWPADPPPDQLETAEIREDEYWDVKETTNAARSLLADLPVMLSHWEGLVWSPTTAGGYPAIKNLEQALLAAMPYIEQPFGPYEPRTGHKEPKDWHIYAIVIANLITKLLVDSGRAKPALTHNSVAVRIIYQAIRRMGIPDADMITHPAIGAHLGRWQELYGRGIGSKGRHEH
jgi:hypothetical protein